MVTRERVLELLRYEPETGNFYWRMRRGPNVAGRGAGGPNSGGYHQIKIDGRIYYTHRLVWLVETGEWPPQGVDHINRLPADNRFVNLREASQAQNQQNCSRRSDNKSGFTGVTWDRRANRWRAQIQKNRLQHNLGYFDTPEEAAEAYAAAKAQLHTFHPEVVQ